MPAHSPGSACCRKTQCQVTPPLSLCGTLCRQCLWHWSLRCSQKTFSTWPATLRASWRLYCNGLPALKGIRLPQKQQHCFCTLLQTLNIEEHQWRYHNRQKAGMAQTRLTWDTALSPSIRCQAQASQLPLTRMHGCLAMLVCAWPLQPAQLYAALRALWPERVCSSEWAATCQALFMQPTSCFSMGKHHSTINRSSNAVSSSTNVAFQGWERSLAGCISRLHRLASCWVWCGVLGCLWGAADCCVQHSDTGRTTWSAACPCCWAASGHCYARWCTGAGT